jgi:hypothetical protein
MSEDRHSSLGQKLAPFTSGGFFRPLSRPSAAVYIDCAERLVDAADDGGQVIHSDARQLIREVLVSHPDVILDEDEGGQFRDLNQRAAQFFNKLIEAHWIDPRRKSLDEHYVLITPALRRMLRLLCELAEDRPAELKDFAATLRSLCADLLREGALDPTRLGPEEMRQTVKDIKDRAGRAEEQMHAVETLIIQQESAQRESGSAQETLHRFLVEFHAGEHMVCYDALQEGGLLPRLNQARSIVQEAMYDPFTKQRLAEGLAAHLELDARSAYVEAERWLIRLERKLASIPVKQRLIDGRMADFARLSDARHRYQTEMRGRRPEQVKAYTDDAARIHAGKSFSSLASEPGMGMLSPRVKIYFGSDSFAPVRRQKAPVNLMVGELSQESDANTANEEIRRHNLNVLTPQRAVRFVEKYLPEKGSRISTESIRIIAEDDLLDMFAALAFDRGAASTGHRSVRWRVLSLRSDLGTEPDRIPRDAQSDRIIERFTLERIS